MEALLFGTAGIPRSSVSGDTVTGIKRIKELGLDCMELEFVQSVRMGEAAAQQVRHTAAQFGIVLTAHAPYYINLNSREPEKIRASQQRLLKTAQVANQCGAVSVIFHPAFYMGDPPETVYENVRRYLSEVLEQLTRENNYIWIRPEVMGKPSQFGTLEEIVELSSELDRVAPGIDFSHGHARNGANNTYSEFNEMLYLVQSELGQEYLSDMHIHISGIAYGLKGEKHHLNLEDSDFNYADLLRSLYEYRATGTVICESPNLEEDALLLRHTYLSFPRE